jgi:hypothetical protein
MKWELLPGGDWIAQGEKGHFLLWKERIGWKGLYMVEGSRVVKFRWWNKHIKDLKKRCENSEYWEG